MDLLFAFLVLALVLYSGVYILYFIVKAFLPSSTQKRSTSSQRANSSRNQQGNIRRTASNQTPTSSMSRNTQKQQTWRDLASEFKEAMNEMDSAGSKQTITPKRNASTKPAKQSYEGDGSNEGRFGGQNSRSLEGVSGREGSASYEGTEFHPQGHITKQKPLKKKVVSRKPYGTTPKVTKTDLQKNIVNAVIYKEILDKPRSKRPIR